MYKLITVSHALKIVEILGCKKCEKQIERVCPSDCEVLQIKYKLAEADADAVLAAIDVRLI